MGAYHCWLVCSGFLMVPSHSIQLIPFIHFIDFTQFNSIHSIHTPFLLSDIFQTKPFKLKQTLNKRSQVTY